jgi:hypothetical protein
MAIVHFHAFAAADLRSGISTISEQLILIFGAQVQRAEWFEREDHLLRRPGALLPLTLRSDFGRRNHPELEVQASFRESDVVRCNEVKYSKVDSKWGKAQSGRGRAHPRHRPRARAQRDHHHPRARHRPAVSNARVSAPRP